MSLHPPLSLKACFKVLREEYGYHHIQTHGLDRIVLTFKIGAKGRLRSVSSILPRSYSTIKIHWHLVLYVGYAPTPHGWKPRILLLN
jgi:hypothetical protein